jgi:hypothetical protein
MSDTDCPLARSWAHLPPAFAQGARRLRERRTTKPLRSVAEAEPHQHGQHTAPRALATRTIRTAKRARKIEHLERQMLEPAPARFHEAQGAVPSGKRMVLRDTGNLHGRRSRVRLAGAQDQCVAVRRVEFTLLARSAHRGAGLTPQVPAGVRCPTSPQLRRHTARRWRTRERAARS